jgi:hypothetical protein
LLHVDSASGSQLTQVWYDRSQHLSEAILSSIMWMVIPAPRTVGEDADELVLAVATQPSGGPYAIRQDPSPCQTRSTVPSSEKEKLPGVMGEIRALPTLSFLRQALAS